MSVAELPRPPAGEARIQSIGRAAALLNAMAAGDWVVLRDLARLVALPKTTAFNLVAALVDTGLVEHDPKRGAYRLGLKHIEYGRAVERRLDLASLARPYLVRLCAATRETVNLAMPRPADALIVDSLEGSQNVRVTSYSGTRAAYHSTACGRALLAFQPLSAREAIYALTPLEAMTPHTITTREGLEALMADCRRDGWVAEREENELGACCVAAPIFGAADQVVGAVSVAGPVSRMDEDALRRFGALLVDTLRELNATLRSGAP